MRVAPYFVLALLSCSCASNPCGDAVPTLGARGRTVISDIDDTIKHTHVNLGRTHIRNPAIVLDGLRQWHPVAGMADLYAKLWGTEKRTNVIYVSAGPCRYEKRLRRLIPKWRFPSGQIVLRRGGPIAPHNYKITTISHIIERSPGRHFVLVGDSGERDPESYGELAWRFKHRIDAIYIRDISADKPRRYQLAFARIPPHKIHFLPADL